MFYNSLNKFYEKKRKSDFSYFKHLKLISQLIISHFIIISYES